MSIKKEDIKELCSIDFEDGVLILIKRDVDKWVNKLGHYSYSPDMLVNPTIKILDSGVLTFGGLRLSYDKISNPMVSSYKIDRIPQPVTELKGNWRDLIYYDEEDIFSKDIVSCRGIWPFRKRIEKKIEHLKVGKYLKTTGYYDTQSTSNYRIIGFKNLEVNGLIK